MMMHTLKQVHNKDFFNSSDYKMSSRYKFIFKKEHIKLCSFS